MDNHFPFSYQKVKKLPKISDGTRFYPADTSNPNLFIARSQYYDTLIHQLPEGFISIYHTKFGERIFSASVLDSQKWYLITILRFGDGIEMRPSYRSIFLAITNFKLIIPYISNISKAISLQNSTNHDEYKQFDKWNTDIERIFLNSVVYPVSTRTYFPQYVSWTYFNSSLFMFTVFDNKIHTFEVAYDKASVTYKISHKTTANGYSFRSALFLNTPHVYLIQSGNKKSRAPLNLPQCASPYNNSQNNNHDCISPVIIDRTKSDIPIKFKLPDEIKICPSTEIHVFISPFRRKITQQINEDRCILVANLDNLYIVFPSSGYFIDIPNDYKIEEYIEIAKKSNPNIKINIKPKDSNDNNNNHDYAGYSMEEAYFRPASRMPLYLFENNLLLVAAPQGFITAILIDQDDRIRASFMVPTFEHKNKNDNDNDDKSYDDLHNLFSLNNKASYALSETTGEIFKMQLNAVFFASKNPLYVIPLLHYFIHPKKDVEFLTNSIIIKNKIDCSIIQLVTEDALQMFWNCEIFNEILLLQFNTSNSNATFRERVCSTFAKSHFYKQCNSLFVAYENVKNESKNMDNKITPKPFLKSKTPDHENFMKMRSNSLILDLENANKISEISKDKPPLSPIISSRHPSFDNSNDDTKAFSYGSEIDNDDNDEDDDEEISISPSLNNFITPRSVKKGSNYPSSLPKNKSTNITPSQPLSLIYKDDEIENTSKVPLSSFVSSPVSHINDESVKMLNVYPIFNFRDIESKATKVTLESLQLNDMQSFFKNVLKIFNESIFFDLFKYSEKIRFACYMQFIAIKLSLSEKPFHESLIINDNLFKKNSLMSSTVKDFWSALSLISHDIRWPETQFRLDSKIQANKNEETVNKGLNNLDKNKNSSKLKRQWWFLRSKKNIMLQAEISEPRETLFNFVEQVTNKSEKGFELFQLHQNMFGLSMYQTATKS